MSTFIYYQLYVFLAALYGGIVIGFMYDLYKIYRSILKPKKVIVIVQDLLFWVVISIVAVFVLIYSNDGKIRGYSLIGFVMGALVYNLLLSSIVVKTINKILSTIKEIVYYIYNKVKKVFNSFIKLIIYPYRKVYKFLSPWFLKIKKILNIPNRILKSVKQYLKRIFKKKSDENL